MDNGAVIRVRIAIDRKARGAVLDFTGTSAQLPQQFQRPAGGVHGCGAVRVSAPLVEDEIPMNAGCLKPLE